MLPSSSADFDNARLTSIAWIPVFGWHPGQISKRPQRTGAGQVYALAVVVSNGRNCSVGGSHVQLALLISLASVIAFSFGPNHLDRAAEALIDRRPWRVTAFVAPLINRVCVVAARRRPSS